MWICPVCETANDTYKCSKCGFDKSKDYTRHRFLGELSEKDRKLPEKQNLQKNIMMKDRDFVFGRKVKRKWIRRITFLNGEKTLSLDTWDISEAQDGSVLAYLKDNCDCEKELFIWADGKITANKDCSCLFADYENLEVIEGLENLETGQVENMSEMFAFCKSLRTLDVSHFDTSQVSDMRYMFYWCKDLEKLDVSHFDTSQVGDMSCMFFDCEGLEKLDVSHFDTNQVRDMNRMFCWCEGLEKLDVSYFDTRQVRDMNRMFCGCSGLEKLDVSHFDTNQVEDMVWMFFGCDNLEELDITGFDERKNDAAFLETQLRVPTNTEVKR